MTMVKKRHFLITAFLWVVVVKFELQHLDF